MTTRLLALMLCLCWSAAAWAQSSIWPNEPAGFTTVLDCPFSADLTTPATYCNIQDVYNSTFLDSDSTEPISPSGVNRSTIFAGNNSGGSQLEYFTPSNSREIFVGLMWRTNPQFEGRQVGNKTFFVGQPGGSGVFLFGNSALVNGQAPFIFAHNSSNLDNSHTCSLSLGLACYPNVGPGIATRGIWTKIETYMKDSTSTISRDGILRWWLNGAAAGNYTNYNFWATGFNTWKFTPTWDGTVNPVPTVDWSHYLGHLHISVGTCTGGCGGGTTPPPPPPPPPNMPSNLRVQ